MHALSNTAGRQGALRLVPLVLALAVSQAYGAPVNGTPGSPGANGATPGAAGTSGGAGGEANATETSATGQAHANSVGGLGGDGGNGAAGTVGGNGGNGGNGGAAIAYAETLGLNRPVSLDAIATGGAGGTAGTGAAVGGLAGNGGIGGDALAQAVGSGTGGQRVAVIAEARAGDGGASSSGLGGASGAAKATASGSSDTGRVFVETIHRGGKAGGSTTGRPADGRALDVRNTVTGSTRGELVLRQYALGETGGSTVLRGASTPVPGRGGDVNNTLELTDGAAAVLTVDLETVGGSAGYAINEQDIWTSQQGYGGNANTVLKATSTRVGSTLNGKITVNGGRGGAAVGAGAAVASRADGRMILRGQGDVTADMRVTGGDEGAVALNGSRNVAGGASGELDIVAAGNVNAFSYVTGGTTWDTVALPGNGPTPANAVTNVSRAVSTGTGTVSVNSSATGTHGGSATGTGFKAGRGSDATMTGAARSAGGVASMYLFATGGKGGAGNGGADGGNGGDAIVTGGMNSNTTGKLTIFQRATGGAFGISTGGKAGLEGRATSTIQIDSDAAELFLTSTATSTTDARAVARGTAKGAVTVTAEATGPGSALAYGASTGGAAVNVSASMNGAFNPNVASTSPNDPAAGAARIVDAVSGSTTGALTLTQIATSTYGRLPARTPGGGGNAESLLTLRDTSAATIAATVRATGLGSSHSALSMTNVTATSTRAVSEATGGPGATGTRPSAGGAATAELVLAGKGALEGRAQAQAGSGGGISGTIASTVPIPVGGEARARAVVEGDAAVIASSRASAGAAGSIREEVRGVVQPGSKAYSRAEGRSSGAGDVIVVAEANGGSGNYDWRPGTTGSAGGTVEVSGYGSSEGGKVDVTVMGRGGWGAVGSHQSGDGGAVVLHNAASGKTTGALVLTQTAIGGWSYGSAFYGRDGESTSTLSLVDTRAASLTLTAVAERGTSTAAIDATGKVVTLAASALGANGGNGTAHAAGTASGLAQVRADASREKFGPGADARATAIAISTGDKATAAATATKGVRSEALAQATGAAGAGSTAQAGGTGGSAVARSSTTGGSVQVTTNASAQLAGTAEAAGNALAITSANLGGAVPALVDPAAAQAVSHATALPEGATLADAPLLAAGTQGASYAGAGTLEYETSAGFTFDSAGGDLMLTLLGANGTGSGLTQLELTVSGNGTELFSRSFTSLADALGFFGSGSLDLGTLAAGSQELVLTTGYTFAGAGGLAFNYALAVTAVPEPGTWMLLLCGLALLAARAHRQRNGTR